MANRDHQLWLENGKPMLFAGDAKGIALDVASLSLKVVDVVDGNWEAAGVLVHDVTNRTVAHMLVEMPFGEFPMALGVLYDDPRPTFDSAVIEQNAAVVKGKTPDLQKLIATGQTWTVDA
jgi:2-oxoglutarate ferredoxin oxidoreductase subunit beta